MNLDDRGRLSVFQWRWARYAPHVVVFFASAFIMVLELVAGRLVARHLGNSLYTWTSVIGVILAGISIGNYLGGRLADRWQPERILGLLFLVASALSVSALPMNRLFAEFTPLEGFFWPSRTFLTVLGIFALPAVALGAISPAAAKMAVDRGEAVGRTIGSVYAWGAIGSILGTFVAGFWLIATLGAKEVVLSVALCLAIMAALVGPGRWMAMVWAAALGTLLFISQIPANPDSRTEAVKGLLGLGEAGESLFVADSNYQYICVTEVQSERDSSRVIRKLQLDYLIHGYVDPDDPEFLEYAYERIYRDVAKRYLRDKTQISAFFIGGGSYTFPRWVLSQWPGSAVDVAEIDPLVAEANYKALGLPTNTSIRTVCADARIAVEGLSPNTRYDLVIGDAFNDLSVPYHLTTLEFNEKVAGHLTPGGAYLLNIIDDWAVGRLLGAVVATLKKTFTDVQVFCTDETGVKAGRQTFVLAASMAQVDFSDWRANHSAGFEGSVLSEQDLDALEVKSKGLILTDDFAPVENLLEPVVRKRD
jgi:spermidine synthase